MFVPENTKPILILNHFHLILVEEIPLIFKLICLLISPKTPKRKEISLKT